MTPVTGPNFSADISADCKKNEQTNITTDPRPPLIFQAIQTSQKVDYTRGDRRSGFNILHPQFQGVSILKKGPPSEIFLIGNGSQQPSTNQEESLTSASMSSASMSSASMSSASIAPYTPQSGGESK